MSITIFNEYNKRTMKFENVNAFSIMGNYLVIVSNNTDLTYYNAFEWKVVTAQWVDIAHD